MLKIKIKKIFNTNQKVIKLSNYDFINYLDTSSITENYITNIQKLNVKKDDIPSRAKRLVKENTIVYSSVRPNLKHYGIIRKPINNMVASTGFITLDIKDSRIYDVDYLYYNLTQEKYTKYLSIIANNSVSSYPSINPADVENLEIEIEEDINIQKKISKVLSIIDSKIELNNKINSELEKVAKELYDYWFIQFEFPDKNNRPYKTNKGTLIYNETLKRKIPYNWTVDKLKKICDIKSGYPFSSDNYVSNGIYGIITIKNVQNGYIDIHTDNYINSLPNDLPQYCVLEKGDILLSLTGNVGRVGLIYTDNLLLNQRVAKIVPKSKYLYSYIYFLIKNNHFRNILEQKSTGTSQKNLSPIETENIDIIVPDKNTIEEFDRNVKSIIEKIVNNWTENKFLIDLREFLLPMLMNGQISIKD